MSSLNGFNGQQVRPGQRPAADQPQAGHPYSAHANGGGQHYPGQAPQAWQPQGAHYQQPPQQWAHQGQQPYPQQGYGQLPAAGDYGQPKAQQGFGGQPSYGSLTQNPDAFAPNFEPYSPVTNPRTAPPAQQPNASSYAPQPAADYGAQGSYGQSHYGQQPQHNGYGQPQQAHQWPGNSHGDQHAAARGFDAYQQQPSTGGHPAYRQTDHAEPSFSEWPQAQPQGAHGYDYGDANGYHHGQHQGGETDEMGFAQAAGGELDQGYADEDGEEYEIEETGRGRRPLMIAAALAGAIFVGGGMAYSYKAIFGGNGAGNPPMVKSASEPSKIKPADAGGKQFAHTDSKIMGRLGDGAATGSASASGELDANGSRKVSTLVVGRDGSIQAPAATPADAAPSTDSSGNVAVPGMMVVDALGGHKNSSLAPVTAEATPAAATAPTPAPQKLVVTPPVAPQKPVTIAKAAVADTKATSDATGSIESEAPAPVTPKPVAKKVAAAKPEVVNDAYTGSATGAAAAAAPMTAPTGANGYVAVLASVPRSDSSRMTALKRFADMQQKFGTVLNGKTPDVAEANLGEKGAYHRLVVGPPASRQQASSLCTELKAQGYNDCWVTAY